MYGFGISITCVHALFLRFLVVSGLRTNELGRFQQEVAGGSILLAMFLCFHYLEGVILLILLDLTSLVC